MLPFQQTANKNRDVKSKVLVHCLSFLSQTTLESRKQKKKQKKAKPEI